MPDSSGVELGSPRAGGAPGRVHRHRARHSADTLGLRLAAKAQPIGELDVRHMKVGDALCVVTNKQQVAWAKVARLREPFGPTLSQYKIPIIDLVVTLWPAL